MEVLRYAGFAEEESFAVSPAPSAAFVVDHTSASLDAAKGAQIMYEGSIGKGPRIHRPGYYSCEGDVEYAFDVRTIGWMLKWALAGYVCTGTGPYTHEIYGGLETFLPSFATFLGKDKHDGTDDFEHVFSGCGIDALELSVEDGYATAKVGIQAAKDSKGTLLSRSQVASLLPEEYPLVFHEVTMSRNNVDISSKVKTLALSIANNLNVEAGRSIGSRFARRNPSGGREVKLSMSLYYEDMDTLALLWGSSAGPVVGGSTETPMVITFDGGSDGSMQIILPRYLVSEASLPTKGKDEIDHTVEGDCYEDEVELEDEATSVTTQIYCILENDQAEMTTGGS